MAVSEAVPVEAIACWRSVVKVAMPQRRGSELPRKATRRDLVKNFSESSLNPHFTRLEGAVCTPAHLGSIPNYLAAAVVSAPTADFGYSFSRSATVASRPAAATGVEAGDPGNAGVG